MYLYVYTFVDKDWKGMDTTLLAAVTLRTGGDEGWVFFLYFRMNDLKQ